MVLSGFLTMYDEKMKEELINFNIIDFWIKISNIVDRRRTKRFEITVFIFPTF